MGVHDSGPDHRGAGGVTGLGGSPADERLATLIRDGLAVRSDHPVDVESLLDGARTGARRIRRRRRAGARVAVAAVVLGVLPVAVSGLHHVTGNFGPPGQTGVAAGGNGSTASAAAGAKSDAGPSVDAHTQGGGPTPFATSSRGTVPGAQVSGAPPIEIADAAVLPVNVLPDVRLGVSFDQAVVADGGPTVQQVCRVASPAVAQVSGGRQLDYVESGHAGDPWALTTLVRVLPGQAADTEVDQLRRSMGYCASDLSLKRAGVSRIPGDGVALGYQVGVSEQRPGAVLVIGVVRQGPVTASVELIVPARAAADNATRVRLGLEQARRLLTLADERLLSSGLVQQAVRDPQHS